MDTCFLFYQLQSILLALQLTLRLIMPISHLTTTFQNKSLSSFPIPHTYLVPCVDIPVQQFSKLLPSIIAKHKTSQSMPTLYFSSSINLHQKTLIFLGLPILLVNEIELFDLNNRQKKIWKTDEQKFENPQNNTKSRTFVLTSF